MGNLTKHSTPRIRMFAGPNGSGKSTIKAGLNQELLGVYVNPDEMEYAMQQLKVLDLAAYQVQTTRNEVVEFFKHAELLRQEPVAAQIDGLHLADGKLMFHDVPVNSYVASVAADFIRTKLLERKASFSFETVMSHPSKVELLRRAQQMGYRTYLYYIATEDPEVNISRIQYRVAHGGHAVPREKMIERYYRSIELLLPAVQASNRAYIFDNSHEAPLWIAEITEGKTLETKTDQLPSWFQRVLSI